MDERRRRFEEVVLPHLDAAANLARWLTRSDAEADDIVQDAMLRAFRAFDGFRGGSAKPWRQIPGPIRKPVLCMPNSRAGWRRRWRTCRGNSARP